MRTMILAFAAASVSLIGAYASLPPAKELTQGEFLWPEQGEAQPEPMPLCSLPKPPSDIVMPTIQIQKSGRLDTRPVANW